MVETTYDYILFNHKMSHIVLLAVALNFLARCHGAVLLRNATSLVVATPTVVLDYVSYEGIRQGNGVDAYLGMRYAAAPTGELRFRAPQDPSPVAEVQDAKAVSFSMEVWVTLRSDRDR